MCNYVFLLLVEKTKQPDKERQKKETKDFKKKQILSFLLSSIHEYTHSKKCTIQMSHFERAEFIPNGCQSHYPQVYS